MDVCVGSVTPLPTCCYISQGPLNAAVEPRRVLKIAVFEIPQASGRYDEVCLTRHSSKSTVSDLDKAIVAMCRFVARTVVRLKLKLKLVSPRDSQVVLRWDLPSA